MEITRDFCIELDESKFKPITYGIYNKLYDDCYINYLKRKYDEVYSIDDFKYYDFELSDKEKFLVRMHNKKYLSNLNKLKEFIKDNDFLRLYIEYDEGLIRIVKLNKIMI